TMTNPAAQRETTFQRGLLAYRAGQHYEAHEIWEELWESEESDDHRRFLQALIQVASAVHKLLHDVGPRGSLRLLERAYGKLEGLPDRYGGIALDRLRAGIQRARVEFERLIAEGRRDLDPSFIPPIEGVGEALAWQHRLREVSPDSTQVLRQGLVAYQAGRFYDAHEIWEELRRHEPEGPLRSFLQGLILTAAAMHKLFTMKSPAGALKMLDLAAARVALAPEGTCGIAVGELASEIARAKAAIGRLSLEDLNHSGPGTSESVSVVSIAPKIPRAHKQA
ncbi:MAG TPA: DUF309 domain-containing protein, partial [Polyangiaceae bacterium]|nr:DUF309 domain-containing protein [Polyangiaceae bacterium]